MTAERRDSEKARQKRVNVGDRERWISVVAGVALAIIAVREATIRSPLTVALLLVAGHLLYRGLAGHDRLYAAVGIATNA